MIIFFYFISRFVSVGVCISITKEARKTKTLKIASDRGKKITVKQLKSHHWDDRKMPNSKSILKILFALGVWSFVVIGLFKIHSNNIVLEDYPQAPMSGRLLLQKDSKFNFEATSTTTDRVLPLDVLIDSRQGKKNSIYSLLCR